MKTRVCAILLFCFSVASAQQAGHSPLPKNQNTLDGFSIAFLEKGESRKVSVIINNNAPFTVVPLVYYQSTLIQKPDSIDYAIESVQRESYKQPVTNLTMYRDVVGLSLVASKRAVPGMYFLKMVFRISTSQDMSFATKDSLKLYISIKPQLISPDKGQAGLSKDVAFKWNKVVNSQKYYIQLSNTEAFTTITKTDSTTTDTTKTITGLSSGQKYYWRIQPRSSTWGYWSYLYSDIWNFTTMTDPPNAPVANAATSLAGQTGFTANWNAVADAALYYLDVSTSGTFSGFVTGFNGKDVSNVTKYPVSGLTSNTTYYYRVRAYNTGGTSPNSNTVSVVATGIMQDAAGMPGDYGLEQNFPNPFNPSTTIRFSLPASADVALVVYDAMGKEVARLVSRRMNAGNYTAEWNASGFESGIYYCRIVADHFSQTRKLLLLK